MTGTDPRNAGKGRHHEQDAVVHHYTEEELHHLDVAHEASDVDVRAVLLFAVGLAVVTIVSAVIVWGMFRFLENGADARDARVSPLAMPETEMPRHTQSPFFGAAPQPQLLTNEPVALREFRHSEAKRCTGTAGSTRTRKSRTFRSRKRRSGSSSTDFRREAASPLRRGWGRTHAFALTASRRAAAVEAFPSEQR